MAYSYDSLLNLVSGNVRDCTFYMLNGQHIVRKRSFSIQNPRTPYQQSNRKNIKPLLIFFRQLKPVLYLSLNDRSENQSACNKFLSINLNASMKNGIFDPAKFRMSTDSFPAARFEVSRQLENRDSFWVRWSDVRDGDSLASDRLLAVYYDVLSNAFQYAITSKSRSDQEASLSFKVSDPQSGIFLYLCFVRADYSASSGLSVFEFT